MLKKAKDGHKYYSYYVKKRGRRHKPGPKPKPKPRKEFHTPQWNFKIVRCAFKKQDKFIGYYHNAEEAEYVKNILLKENEKVKFPVKYKTLDKTNNKQKEFECEYLILKKIREEGVENTSMLRNEFGKLVKHTTNNKRWLIYDKFPCHIEETFWVYGYNPSTERKTYDWIIENFVNDKITERSDMVQILLYNNKVLFIYLPGVFDFVICKTKSDAIKMYNLLENEYKKNKQVFFTGQVSGKNNSRVVDVVSMIAEKTGWTRLSILRTSTRH